MPSEKLIDLLLAYLCERLDKTTEISKSNAEWEALLQLSINHGVAPLFYQHLTNAGTQVPEGVLNSLRKAYHSNVFQNAQYYQQLSEVLKHLQRGGIEIIVLKGAYLAKTVYQSEALRVFGDIDLLVKKADLDPTEKILLEMGYGPTKRPSIKAQCAMSHHLEPFIKKGAFPIEVHWTLFDHKLPFKNRVDMLWEQTRPFTVASVQVLSLSPENLLFHLCVHTAYASSFVGVRFLCDIHKTLGYYQDQIDWDDLFDRARQWKAEKAVYIVLYLARDWLGAQVPSPVLDRFKPDDFNLELVANTKKIISIDAIHWVVYENNFGALWMPNKPYLEKLSIFLKKIFPPLKSLANIYKIPENSLRLYFYYPVHLKCILVKYSGMVWRMLRGDKKTRALMAQNRQVTMLKDWMKSN